MTNNIDLGSLMNKSREAEATPLCSENIYLAQPEKGLELFASLLANSNKSDTVEVHLGELHNIIEHQFLNHTDDGENTTSANTYANLQIFHKRLAEMVSFPRLEKSYTVAVGGSFSAGKSYFLNSVLGCPSLLPTDTTPTTSIPTYLYQGENDSIHALNIFHKKTTIDKDAFNALCHEFYSTFGVAFSHLLQLIAVERKAFVYSNLIFLDTPGYNKADDVQNEENSTDKQIAREHLRRADYLIWLVNQQNGTIPTTDIDFIRSLNLKQPLMVVISQADVKPEADIFKIITRTQADLDSSAIDYVNVIAYSAFDKHEISVSGNALTSFLQKINHHRGGATLLWQAHEIFREYMHHYDSRKQTLKLTLETLQDLAIDEGVKGDNKKTLQDLLQKTKSQIEAINNEKKEAEKISAKYCEKLEKLCQKLGIENNLKPNLLQLKSSRQANVVESEVITCIFDALLDGDVKQLSHISALDNLPGTITKLSNTFIHVQLDNVSDFEMVIMKQTVKNKLGAVNLTETFHEGQTVQVQIVNDKKAQITVVTSN